MEESKLNLTNRELHKTVEAVERGLHEAFGFSVERQKKFEKLYALCLKTELEGVNSMANFDMT